MKAASMASGGYWSWAGAGTGRRWRNKGTLAVPHADPPPPLVSGTCITRCALVTGSNKGIGFEICRLLLQAGIQVIVTARDQGRGQQAADRLRAGPGGAGVLGFACLDVSDEPSVTQLPAAVKDMLPHGHLDILVNNAGIAYLDSTFGRDEARATVDINALGTIRVTRALLPVLLAAPSGRVINVASGQSGSLGKAVSPDLRKQFVNPNLTDDQLFRLMDDFVESVAGGNQKELGWLGTMYDVSKLAQIAFSVALARQLFEEGLKISISCCCPGFVKTDMCDFCYGSGSGKISAAQGADTPVWLALRGDPESLATSGYFFRRRRVVHGLVTANW